MQSVMIRCQRSFKCMAACEVLPWPDCGWPSNTITHPTPFAAAKPPKPPPFRVYDLNSVRSIWVNITSSSFFVCCRLSNGFWVLGKVRQASRPALRRLVKGSGSCRPPGRFLRGLGRPFDNLESRLQQSHAGATAPLAVGRQVSVLDRLAPSMSRGLSAAHHRR